MSSVVYLRYVRYVDVSKALSATRKKLKLVSSFVRGRPIWCTWQVTYRCLFRCRICDYWKNQPAAGSELSLEEIARGSENISRLGSFVISIGGGEPFLRDDLPDIIKALSLHHLPLVTTNGYLITRSLAREVFRSGLWGVSVSLDYCDPDRHDAQRGVKGAFERALNAIKIFSEERQSPLQRVNLMAVLKDDNLGEMEGLIRLAEKHGAYFMVQPYCDIKSGKDVYRPEGKVSARLLELRKKHKNFLSNPLFLSRFDAALDGGVPGCVAGKAFFNIDNYGNVAMCVEALDKPVANILKNTPEEIMAGLKTAYKENSCRACWYNCRGEVESLYSLRGFIAALPTIFASSGTPSE